MRARLRDLGLYHPETPDEGLVKQIIGFGHIGDGNLHLNIMTKERTKELEDAIEPYVYELVKANDGSISAEHGLGVMKSEYLGYSKSPNSIEMMKKVKKLFDPNGILNPYKYFPTR